MLKTIRRLDKAMPLVVALIILGTTTACEWFPESTFQLASDSRLPKWITLPPGLTRKDVSITMNYYVPLWGSRSATFTLQDTKGKTLKKVSGKVKGSEPFELKNPPSGFPPGYPSYEIITVGGTTDIIEHRRPEPIFYVTDDPAVWKDLGVRQK
jgi:hypothetical protein